MDDTTGPKDLGIPVSRCQGENGHTFREDVSRNNETDHKSVRSASEMDKCNDDGLLIAAYLDELDDRIESLKCHALALSQEKKSLLLVLTQLKEESMAGSLTQEQFQDVCFTMDRLKSRCEAVSIKVETVRSEDQQEAYAKVISLIDELETSCTISEKENDSYKKAQTFLNACSSDIPENGVVDFKFQGMVLDCVIDDQKSIRNRLGNLVRSRTDANRPVPPGDSHTTQSDVSNHCIRPSAISQAVNNHPFVYEGEGESAKVDPAGDGAGLESPSIASSNDFKESKNKL